MERKQSNGIDAAPGKGTLDDIEVLDREFDRIDRSNTTADAEQHIHDGFMISGITIHGYRAATSEGGTYVHAPYSCHSIAEESCSYVRYGREHVLFS